MLAWSKLKAFADNKLDVVNPLPNDNFFFYSSHLKELADDNLKFHGNGRKVFEKIENTVGKGEIARYEQFLLFPQCFQNSCTADT